MKEITQLWTKLSDCLFDINSNDAFIKELYDKFGEIFDLKDVYEYKNSAVLEGMSPGQFQLTSAAMRRALVEGYLLAQMEQKKDDIKHLYNCYREELNSGKDNFNLDKYPNIPRCSIN